MFIDRHSLKEGCTPLGVRCSKKTTREANVQIDDIRIKKRSSHMALLKECILL
jgi:hypothetical protein